VTFTDRKGQATTLTYDVLNRVTLITHADGSTTTYTWDPGNRPQLRIPTTSPAAAVSGAGEVGSTQLVVGAEELSTA